MSNSPDDPSVPVPPADPEPASAQPVPAAEAAAASGAERFRQAYQPQPGATADEAETNLWSGGYSSRDMLGKWLLAALVTIIPPAVIWYFQWGQPAIWWGWAAVALLVWLGFALELLYRRWSLHYLLTTQRFLHEQGLLWRATDRIEVIDIDDVTFEQGPVQRLTGVGNIKIISSDRTHPELWMRGIADVRDVANLIDDTRRKERRLRGVHVEAI
jgi:membrane protein YdbS with pleckstrin-like domain